MITVKERILQHLTEARKVKVPDFKTPEQMWRFIGNMHPDETPDSEIYDPETGEVHMVPGQTKRKLAKQKLKQAKPKENPAIWIDAYSPKLDGRGNWNHLGEFKKLYNVVMRDYSKEVDDAEHLRKHDYDVDFEYPAAIKRKDGKPFDEFDVENVNSFIQYSNDILPGRNIKIMGKAKKGQRLIKPSVELH